MKMEKKNNVRNNFICVALKLQIFNFSRLWRSSSQIGLLIFYLSFAMATKKICNYSQGVKSNPTGSINRY